MARKLGQEGIELKFCYEAGPWPNTSSALAAG
jgi:hypothetical protein